jgi:hypothetical protein
LIATLAKHHTGGQLSVAPEHSNKSVLDKMKKPGVRATSASPSSSQCASEDAGKNQFLVPYFISGHPGSTLRDMVDLALWLKSGNMRPRQVQDFIPTPMSIATTMYHTGIDPLTRTPVYTAKDLHEKRLQKALLLYWDPAHHDLTREALLRRGAGTSSAPGRAASCRPPRARAPSRSTPQRKAQSRTAGGAAATVGREERPPGVTSAVASRSVGTYDFAPLSCAPAAGEATTQEAYEWD